MSKVGNTRLQKLNKLENKTYYSFYRPDGEYFDRYDDISHIANEDLEEAKKENWKLLKIEEIDF